MVVNKRPDQGENADRNHVVAVICKNSVLQALTEQSLCLSQHSFTVISGLDNAGQDKINLSLSISDDIQTLSSIRQQACPKILLKKGRSEQQSHDTLQDTGGVDAIEITLPVRWGTFTKRLEDIVFSGSDVQDIRFSGYHLSGAHSLLTQEDTGEVRRLTEKERDMLLFFYKNRDRAVSREEILAHVWGYADTAETHTVETHIYRLRQKIEKDPARPEIVITEDEGYRVLF